MYEDWGYSFVPEFQNRRGPSAPQAHGHRRRESLLQQPNGIPPVADAAEPLAGLYEDEEHERWPPEATLARRAKSYSDFYDIVREHLSKDARSKKRRRRRDKGLEALVISGMEAGEDDGLLGHHPLLDDDGEGDELLEASQQEHVLYHDQLAMTERHLDALIEDTNSALELLASLSGSFRAVEDQTSSFKSQCEDLLSDQRRLEKLADEVGTDLHYYAYLDTVNRRLNAPGASRLVEDEGFGTILNNLDVCIAFMAKNPTYRDAESYLARYQSLLTKALHLLEVGFTGRLDKVSAELSRQLAATQSESARHALAYGRFEEMVLDSYALIPNVQRVVRKAFDPLGSAITTGTDNNDLYANTAKNLFPAYLAARDRALKLIVQAELDAFKAETKGASPSVETAARNYLKQCYERSFNEENLFARLFSIETAYSTASDSAFGILKAYSGTAVNGVNITPLATNLQASLQPPAGLQAICNIEGWITNEYLLLDYDDDETPFARHCRELTARLLSEHLWTFTDALFEAELAKSVTKAPILPDELKIGPVVNGVASSNAYPPVRRALELLVMFDQAMPKERCQRNSPVVYKLVKETIQCLCRAEARLRTAKGGTDPDLFMVKNLLILKNELLSLEIGDIRDQTAGMQHFTHIWETITPQNVIGFFTSLIPGPLWGSSGAAAAANGGKANTSPRNGALPENQDASELLDELLRKAIVAFTQRWGTAVHDALARRMGAKSLARTEQELDAVLQNAFSNQPEVVGKLREAIEINAEAQGEEKGATKGRR